MKIIEIKCPICGASIQADAESKEVTCNICHTTFTLNSEEKKEEPIETPVEMVEEQKEPVSETIPVVQNNYQQPLNNQPKKKKNKKGTKRLLYAFFSILLIVSGIVFYLDYQESQKVPELFDNLPSEIITKAEEKTGTWIESDLVNLAPDVDLNAERVKNNNKDIIGRLEVPDLFNVLVVKGVDNDYYLTHSVKKAYDIRGTEFLDYRLTSTSKQLNIYGHNTRDEKIKVAFLKLEKFLKKDYFDKNKYIVFQHDGGKNIYKILAIKEIRQSNNEHMYIDYNGQEYVKHIQKMTTGEGLYNSREIAYDANSEILVLQTCSHHWSNGFYIVTAVKIN